MINPKLPKSAPQ